MIVLQFLMSSPSYLFFFSSFDKRKKKEFFAEYIYFGKFFLMNYDVNTHECICDRNIFRLERTKAFEYEKYFHLARLNIKDKRKENEDK